MFIRKDAAMTTPRTTPAISTPPPDQLANAIWSKAESVVMEAVVTMTSGLSTPVDVGGAPGKAIHQLPDALKEVIEGIGEYTKEYGEQQAGDGVSGAALRAASGFSSEAAEALLEIANAAATPVLHRVGDAVQGAGEVGGHLDMAVSSLVGGHIGEAMGHIFDAAETTWSTAEKLVKDVPETVRGALVVAGEVLEGGYEMTDAAVDGVFGLGSAIYDEITAPEVNLLDEVRDLLVTEAVPFEDTVSYPGDGDDSAAAIDDSPTATDDSATATDTPHEDPTAQVSYPGDGDDDSYPTSTASEQDDG
jgi:hypothetical protein